MITKPSLFHAFTILCAYLLLGSLCSCEESNSAEEENNEEIVEPTAVTEGSSDITDISAEVTCSYANVPVDALCGVKVFSSADTTRYYTAILHGSSNESYTYKLSGLKTGTQYSYYAYVRYGSKTNTGEQKTFTTKEDTNAPSQGQVIDLGLSVKWASCNVGASAPEEYGGYYAWGETSEKGSYTGDNYQFYNSQTRKYANLGNISGTQYDVARVNWGGSWRMPTTQEQEELCYNCTWKWITYKSINGMLVTGPNGNKIFLPAAGYRSGTDVDNRGGEGYYWSGTQYADHWGYAYDLRFYFHGLYERDYYYRIDGHSVRPVSE